MQKDGRVLYLKEGNKAQEYWNIPIANTKATADCMITTIEEYNALRDSINEYVELLGSQLSEKDCAISDCHHYLELNKCSGPVLVKIASKLTLLLR